MSLWKKSLQLCVRRLAMLDGRRFYIGLALILASAVLLSHSLHQDRHMQGHIYDAMTKYRFRTLTPDPDIVILDIDEKSLALMGTEFGRWPWPRDVLGAVLSELERQQAKAVIFDILFSDPDLKNALSEKAFSAAAASFRYCDSIQPMTKKVRSRPVICPAYSDPKPMRQRPLLPHALLL